MDADHPLNFGIGFALAVGVSLGFRVAWAGAPRITSDVARTVVSRRSALILVISDAVALVYGLALTLFLPFDFRMPTGWELGLGLLHGVLGSAGQMLVVQAYRQARDMIRDRMIARFGAPTES